MLLTHRSRFRIPPRLAASSHRWRCAPPRKRRQLHRRRDTEHRARAAPIHTAHLASPLSRSSSTGAPSSARTRLKGPRPRSTIVERRVVIYADSQDVAALISECLHEALHWNGLPAIRKVARRLRATTHTAHRSHPTPRRYRRPGHRHDLRQPGGSQSISQHQRQHGTSFAASLRSVIVPTRQALPPAV
jgi:hypothetical protein